jgi:hypothetical protein
MAKMVKVNFSPDQTKKVRRGIKLQLCSFFNFGTRWKCVLESMVRSVYPWE